MALKSKQTMHGSIKILKKKHQTSIYTCQQQTTTNKNYTLNHFYCSSSKLYAFKRKKQICLDRDFKKGKERSMKEY
jgi:hypothetical protein